MILTNFKDFPHSGRILGIDWGAKRIGLAVSDERQEFVFPRETIKGQMDKRAKGQNETPICLSALLSIIHDESIAGIVIGLPIRSDGSESATTRAVRLWSAELSEQSDSPIIFMEENLTSVEAEEMVGANENSPNNKRREIDSIAAAVILENAIAMMRRSES